MCDLQRKKVLDDNFLVLKFVFFYLASSNKLSIESNTSALRP